MNVKVIYFVLVYLLVASILFFVVKLNLLAIFVVIFIERPSFIQVILMVLQLIDGKVFFLAFCLLIIVSIKLPFYFCLLLFFLLESHF
jgi:hypothetical protein